MVRDGRDRGHDGRMWRTDVTDGCVWRTDVTDGRSWRTDVTDGYVWRTDVTDRRSWWTDERDVWMWWTDVTDGCDRSCLQTRPDTRPPVADGWAGAEMRVFPLFNLSVTDRPTNRPTHQPTNGRMDKASYRVACPQLKKKIWGKYNFWQYQIINTD